MNIASTKAEVNNLQAQLEGTDNRITVENEQAISAPPAVDFGTGDRK
jgi:hypothetical protein